MEIGLKYRVESMVNEENTAKAMGSGDLEVYATPSMVALMEKAASQCVKEALEEGQGTVGTLVNIKHISATPLNMEVWAEAELIEVDGKRLCFTVRAYDEKGMIGEGAHERFIIANSKFMERTNAKNQ